MNLKKVTAAILATILLLGSAIATTTMAEPTWSDKEAKSLSQVETKFTGKKPKYVFLFIGDGMSSVQINSAQVFQGNNKKGEVSLKKLNFTKFPVMGMQTTQDATSFDPDSASTATSISSGIKTHSGVIGLGIDKTTAYPTITEMLKKEGMKVGVISSVTLNHATPAAFYAHVPSRGNYYDIAMQMAQSNFDYFAGGTLGQNKGKEKDKKDAFEVLKENGYTILRTKEEIKNMNPSQGKVYAVNPKLQDSGSMAYSIDTKEDDVTLADLVEKGIAMLDNEKGFFLMTESGKIDWACHANDAMTTIQEVLGLEKAIQKAIDFASKHPDETLILVTGDHETGGMTIGYATTGYDTAFDLLKKQKLSYVEFDGMIKSMKEQNPKMTLENMIPVIKENFGLIAPDDKDAHLEENKPYVLTPYEFAKLKNGFEETMKGEDQKVQSQETDLLYGGYEPLSITLTHLINNKAGIGWTSYSHTGVPEPVHAVGARSDAFGGYYDNTDLFFKMKAVMDLK